jgi:hypothetical protein
MTRPAWASFKTAEEGRAKIMYQKSKHTFFALNTDMPIGMLRYDFISIISKFAY